MAMSTEIHQRYTPEMLLKRPGEGEKTATDMVIMARARDMGGDFSVMQGLIKPGELLAPHTHKYEDQLVYVISGNLTFELGGKSGIQVAAGAGCYVQKPRGIMHAFWNTEDEPANYIELSGQSGFEGFVDSKANGDLKSARRAEDDWGMEMHLGEAVRLVKNHRLTGFAFAETPYLPHLPELPEALKRIFEKIKR
jgi:quercetin dioxygenase-like cupin family protein